MPQAVVPAIKAVLAKVFTKAALVAVVKAVAINFAVSAVSRKLAGKNTGGPDKADLQAQVLTASGSQAARSISYGTVFKAGFRFFRQATGQQNSIITECHAFAPHEIDAFVSVHLGSNYRSINIATDLDPEW